MLAFEPAVPKKTTLLCERPAHANDFGDAVD
jgi:hypothetical protein